MDRYSYRYSYTCLIDIFTVLTQVFHTHDTYSTAEPSTLALENERAEEVVELITEIRSMPAADTDVITVPMCNTPVAFFKLYI